MADEKETKLEIVDIPKPLKDLENTIRDVFPKIAKIGQDMGKDLAGAIIKGYENMGYEFREVEIQKSESSETQKQNEQIPPNRRRKMTDEEKLAERYVNGIPIFAEEGEGFSRTQMQQAYLAGLEAGRPKWHKVADGDLPKVGILVLSEQGTLVLYKGDGFYWVEYSPNADNIKLRKWEEPIAWCEIPKYMEERELKEEMENESHT